MIRVALAALALGIATAQAAPPPAGSEDARIMEPYAEWIVHQHDRIGRWCCDFSDGRPVEARIAGDHWQAHITPKHFPGETDRWIDVPDEAITRGSNPVGAAMLWLVSGKVQCFAPPDGV